MTANPKPVLVPEHRYKCKDQVVELIELHVDTAVVKYVDNDDVAVVAKSDLEEIPEPKSFSNRAISHIPSAELKHLLLLRDELRRIDELSSGVSKEVDKTADKLHLSPRQVYRLLATWRESPTIWALRLAQTGRKLGARVLGDDRELLIELAIDEMYLTPERPSVAQLHEKIEVLCYERRLAVPSIATVRNRVKRIAKELLLARREGPARARQVCESAAGSPHVTYPLQRVEIDHTLVDVMLRADFRGRKLVGRPWVTLAIDYYTRMILAFYLSFERPCSASVAICLSMAALPKQPWLDAMNVKGAWPCEGKPREIWCDNAMEFRSEALRRGCKAAEDITLHFRPAGTPSFAGTVERLNGTMMGRVHLLPGTTKSNVMALGEYDPAMNAVMTLSEFIPWFAQEIVTGYHLKLHRTLGMPPLVAWEKAIGGTDLRKPNDALEYYVNFLPAEERRLTRVGVQFANELYWADEFGPLVGDNKLVLVHYHPMAAELVYVRLPNGRIAIAKAKGDVKGLTFEDLRRRRADNRQLAKDPALLEARYQGFRLNQERLQAAQEATRAALRDAKKPEPPALPAPIATPNTPLTPDTSGAALEPLEVVLLDD